MGAALRAQNRYPSPKFSYCTLSCDWGHGSHKVEVLYERSRIYPVRDQTWVLLDRKHVAERGRRSDSALLPTVWALMRRKTANIQGGNRYYEGGDSWDQRVIGGKGKFKERARAKGEKYDASRPAVSKVREGGLRTGGSEREECLFVGGFGSRCRSTSRRAST